MGQWSYAITRINWTSELFTGLTKSPREGGYGYVRAVLDTRRNPARYIVKPVFLLY